MSQAPDLNDIVKQLMKCSENGIKDKLKSFHLDPEQVIEVLVKIEKLRRYTMDQAQKLHQHLEAYKQYEKGVENAQIECSTAKYTLDMTLYEIEKNE